MYRSCCRRCWTGPTSGRWPSSGASCWAGSTGPVTRRRTRRGDDWLVLTEPGGSRRLAFQQVDELPRSTWPDKGIPQQLHLDLTVPDIDTLDAQHERALALGATLLDDSRQRDPEEPLRVYADPAGHPFCVFVG